MSVRFSRKVAYLEKDCGSDDAETLLAWLLTNPTGKINLKTCHQLHTAVLQVLLAARPAVTVKPEDQALARWLPTPFGEA